MEGEKVAGQILGERPYTTEIVGVDAWRILDMVIDNIDGIAIKRGSVKNEEGGSIPFLVKPEKSLGSFTRGEKDSGVSGVVRMRNFVVMVDTERFAYGDIPRLFEVIEAEHRQFIGEVAGDDVQFMVEARKNVFRRWVRVADFLDQYPSEEIGDEVVSQEVAGVAKAIRQIAMAFGEGEDELAQNSGDYYTENVFLPKIGKILAKRRGDNPKRGEAIARLVRGGIKEQLERETLQLVFERGVKEVLRQCDLKEEFKRAIAENGLEEIFEGTSNLEEIQRELSEARESGDKTREAEAEIRIAQLVNQVVYDERYWEGKSGKYSFHDIARREINCMARALLQYTMIKTLIGKDVLGADTLGHMTTIMPTADGRMMVLDYNVWELCDNEGKSLAIDRDFYRPGETNYRMLNYPGYVLNWIAVGRLEEVYVANVYRWLEEEIEINDGRLYCSQKALSVYPKSPHANASIANNYLASGEYEKAERHINIAIRESNRQPYYLTGKACLLSIRADSMASSLGRLNLKGIISLIRKAKRDNQSVIDSYKEAKARIKRDRQEAIRLYEEAVEKMQEAQSRDEVVVNLLTVKEMKKNIEALKEQIRLSGGGVSPVEKS